MSGLALLVATGAATRSEAAPPPSSPAVLAAEVAGMAPNMAPGMAPTPALPPALDPVLADGAASKRDKDPGKAALKEASAARSAAQKLAGEEKLAGLQEAAALYDAIAANPEHRAAVRAEACFRAGEILRALQQRDEAERRYRAATERGADEPEAVEFAARGLLERAHLARRGKDIEGALGLYGEVRERFAGHRRSAAHATSWMGKLLLKEGERERAAAHLMGFAEAFPEYPVEAVRNADLLAVELLEAGDETAARSAVERIQRAMEPVLEAGGKTAEAVRKALDGMRVTEQLAGD